MLAKREKFKIFNSVIKLITINMVNYLKPLKPSSKMLFHDIAMFKNLSVSILDKPAPVMNPSFFIGFSPPNTGTDSFFNYFSRLFISFVWHSGLLGRTIVPYSSGFVK